MNKAQVDLYNLLKEREIKSFESFQTTSKCEEERPFRETAKCNLCVFADACKIRSQKLPD